MLQEDEDSSTVAHIFKEESCVKEEPEEFVENVVDENVGEYEEEGGRFVVDEDRCLINDDTFVEDEKRFVLDEHKEVVNDSDEEGQFVVDEDSNHSDEKELEKKVSPTYRPYCLKDPTEYNYTRHNFTVSTNKISTTAPSNATAFNNPVITIKNPATNLNTLFKDRNIEDISTAQAILDLSSPDRTGHQQQLQKHQHQYNHQQQQQINQHQPVPQLLVPVHTYQIVAHHPNQQQHATTTLPVQTYQVNVDSLNLLRLPLLSHNHLDFKFCIAQEFSM